MATQTVKVKKGCVKITGDKEITPVKAGEDAIKIPIKSGDLTTMIEYSVFAADSALIPKE